LGFKRPVALDVSDYDWETPISEVTHYPVSYLLEEVVVL
jgi:hypothetical protein